MRKIGSRKISFDTDSQALFTAMSVQPTLNHKIIIDNTIKRLKSEGIWEKSVAIYVAGHNAQATHLNWKTRVLASGVGTVHVPFKGVKSTGNGIRMTCNEIDFTDTAIWTPSDSHAFAFTTEKGTEVALSRLMTSSTGLDMVGIRYSTGVGGGVMQVNSTSATATTITGPETGSCGACRSSETTLRKHANGIPYGINYTEAMVTSTAGVLNWAGGPGISNLDTQGWANVGKYLTDSQMTALHNIAKYYLDAVSVFAT